MDDVEEIVAENAAFDGAGKVVDRTIDEARNERQGDEVEVFDEGKVKPGKEKGDHNDAKGSRPLGVQVIVDFPLEEAAEKSLFWNGDEEEIGDQKNEPAMGKLEVDVDDLQVESEDHHHQHA